MGASQSSSSGGSAVESETVKTSYYELLGVERTATQEELKKAYRLKALQLHPDRNHGDTERTTALFAEIQSAYEVLSDEQERAWYDAHEGDILRGGSGEGASDDHYQGNMRVTTSDDLVRMMGKFRGKVEFSDSPNGFFGFVRETFEQLAKEEEYAADYEGVDIPNYPTFGHKDDQYDDVVRSFYATWNGFSTAKSFAWLDVYRLSDAPDRRTRRLAEKENQKYRDDGRREFNDTVRALIAFVRKRDPRYTPNRQSDEDKAKEQRDARKAQAARARAAQIAKLEQEAQELPSWATSRDPDELEEETEEESEEEHFECVACNKTFKSERQYEAHERSKKHQKAIQALKRQMQKDNAKLNLDEDGIASGVVTAAEDDEDSVDLSDPENLKKEGDHNGQVEIMSDEAKSEEEITEASPKASAPEQSNGNNKERDSEEQSEDDEDDDDEYASRSDIERRLAGLKTSDTPSTTKQDEVETEDPTPQAPKMGKAAQKRAKKAAKQAEEDQSDRKNNCLGCDATFSSKTQLFQHLQDHPKHAALKTVGGGKKKKGKK